MKDCKEPLVMCLTNSVAQDITANALLAIGAKPAMVSEPEEAAELSQVADAILINLGTVDARQEKTMLAALTGSVPQKMGTVPWVLDPVAVHLLSYRREVMRKLLSVRLPAAIRGNLAEISYIRNFSISKMGSVPPKMGSVPSKMGSAFGCVGLSASARVPMLGTGETDLLYMGTDPKKGTEPIKISGGVEMLTKVTATGCTQGAIVAAFIGRGQSPVEALLAASHLMKQAGERAWEKAKAPGSFRVALIDALAELS